MCSYIFWLILERRTVKRVNSVSTCVKDVVTNRTRQVPNGLKNEREKVILDPELLFYIILKLFLEI